MPNAQSDAFADSLLMIASAEGCLAYVEDDLFRFARTLEGSDDLRLALTDPSLPVDRRLAVIEELMEGKAVQLSTALVGMMVAAGHSADLPEIVTAFVEKAAAERQHEVAEVRSALALDESQISRLAAALSQATGKRVEVRVIVDPSVLGGVVSRIGDTVIDGTVRHRLDQLREQL